MSKIKVLEETALQQLEHSLTHITLAEENLNKASALTDDFPTARHELSDMADKADIIKKKITELIYELKSKKTR